MGIPSGVPTGDCLTVNGVTLLYVGIAPKASPSGGGKPSSQSLWHRIRYHYRGNAEGSTLRLTLGCLLAKELGLELRRVGSGRRLTSSGRAETVRLDGGQCLRRLGCPSPPLGAG